MLNITFREGTGNSSYNALWVTATKRLSRGLQFNTSYTFSKSINYNSQSSQGTTLQDSYNLVGDRGLSDFDARHRFVISGLYELPFSGNQLKEGWQFSLITQLQSGNWSDTRSKRKLADRSCDAAARYWRADHDFRDCRGDRNWCPVLSKSRMRSKTWRIVSIWCWSDLAGCFCERKDDLPLWEYGSKRPDWTRLQQF